MRRVCAGGSGAASWMGFAAAGRPIGRAIVNILVLTNLYPPHHIGGYELICETVVTLLRQRGHYVPILASDHQVAAAEPARDDPLIERVLQLNGFYGHPWHGI